MVQEIKGIFVGSISSRLFQFVLPVTAGSQAYPQSTRPTRGKKVPYAVTDHNAVKDGNTQPLCRRQEQIGIRFRMLHLITSYHRHSSADLERLKRGPGALQHSTGGD